MADLGNLKILLDMATTGNLKDILEKTDKKLEKLREKASTLQLGFDDKSFSSLVTKMNDVAESMQGVSKSVGQKMVEGMKQSAEASKGVTTEMKAQVTLSSDLEALFKEMAGTIRTIAESHGKVTAAKKASVAATKEGVAEEQKSYDISLLRKKAEEKTGKLTADEVAILKQMESIEKALIAIDEKHSTHLADQLKKLMHYDGVTKEQLGTYQAVITRMQAAMQVEQRAARQKEQTARKEKQSAKEREAAFRRMAQLESALIRIDTQLLGLDQSRFQEQTKLLLAKKQNGTITREEANVLSTLLVKEKAMVAMEEKKAVAASNTAKHFGRQSTILQQINSYLATYVSVIGAVNLIRNLVRITGEFEAQHVALRAILQDVAGADRIFYQLQELAVKSPFTFRNLTDYAKQLSAFSVPMNEIYDTTKRLADVSAGLGVDMSRIILAYGQIRSASFLRGQEVRQLTEAGIPVLQELAKQFKEVEGEAISVGKVFDKISARQVPFEMIEKMFKDLTSEGGKFYQMQETLAETVKGKVSNLQDAWEIMLSKIGDDNSAFIKGVINGVTNLIKNYKDLAKAIELAAIAYGTYRAAAMAAAQADSMQRIIRLATGRNVRAIPALLARIRVGLNSIPNAIASIVSKLNPWAIGIAAVTTATAYLIMRQRELNKHIRETDKATSKAIANAEASKSSIHYHIQRLKEAAEGTKEYEEARKAVIDQSGSYISSIDAERLSLQNVDDVWANICKHIEEATKLQTMQTITAEASAAKSEAQLDAMTELGVYQKNNGLTNETRKDIAAYIRGEIDKETLRSRLVSAGIPNPTYKYRENEYGVYSKGSLSEVISKAEEWAITYRRAEAIYNETIARAQESMKDLYGETVEQNKTGGTVLEGWRKRVADYLSTVTGGTRGVKVSDETGLADLAEMGAKALNDLRKQLELIPEEELDYKKVETDIKFWEKLSEVIYGPGNTEFNNSTKKTKQQLKDAEQLRKEQIQAIKQSVQDLKEAKRWYDQLTPLLGDKNAKTLLSSFNFAVPKEGFNAAFQGYADRLTALGDNNGARDVMNWANGREVGDVVNSAKAIEKYTEALRDLEAQTKRLKLSGLAQDLDKIIVDADSKNRQLETNWAQKAEALEKAKDGWIQRYRIENEKATQEEALRAWEDFYKKQTDIAEKAMDTQREYNRKVAQEQINDKASKWLEEMMKENNINLHDMGDKSIGQMDVIISRLRALVASNALANLIPKELKDDAENLKVTFDELIANIERMVDTKVGDVRVDRMKKILGVVSTGLGALGLSANTGAIQDAYAKYVEKMREESQAQKELNKAQEEYSKIAENHQGDEQEYLKYLEKLTDAQNKYNEAASESGEALKGLKFTSVVAGVQALASAFDKLGSSISKLGDAKNDESMKETGETISSISNAVSSAASAALAGFIIGGPIGAAIGGGLSIISSAIGSIFDSYAKAEKYNREVAQSSYSWALGVQQVRNEYALLQEQLDTIFGGPNLAKMAGWRDIIKEQGEAIRKFNSSRARQLAGMELKTYDYGWWDELWGADDDYDSLKNIVPELFNNDGTLNFDYLDTFKSLKWFEELPDEWQAALNQMAEANKAFEDACDQMKDYLTNIFGEVGASISDSLITAFMETGRVALDTGDILADVAKKFVSDWTEAFLVKNYLQGLGDSINDVWANSALDMDEQISQSIGLLRDSLTAMSDRLPEIQQFYQGLEDQFHWADGAGEELGDAIKTAMVEQNSSLMAGYLNSIRADVTMQRNEIMRNISPAVTTISSGITEHFRTVASIEGNVSRIWSRIDLLTSPGSGVRINAKI